MDKKYYRLKKVSNGVTTTYHKMIHGGNTHYRLEKDYEYFYIKNLSNSTNTVTFTTNVSANIPSSDRYCSKIQYSNDGSNWSNLTFNSSTPQTITLSNYQTVYLRNRNNNGVFNYYDGTNYYYTTITTNKITAVGGDLRTLLDYNNVFNIDEIPVGAFTYLFRDNDKLIDASKLYLGYENVNSYSYLGMFRGCTSLSTIPTTIGIKKFDSSSQGAYCCSSMFRDTLITTTPTLPATDIAPEAYNGMFYNCTNLTTAIVNGEILNSNSYKLMFNGCINLSDVTIYVNTAVSNSFENWLQSVAASGTIHQLGSYTLPTGSVSGIPSGWTVVNN